MSLKRMINGQVVDIAGSGGGGSAQGAVTSDTLENGKIWTGTLAEYNLIEDKDDNTLYNITDDSTETLDNVPISGSSNGVTSGGTYAAINAKANISALNDVNLTLPSNNQVLAYNSVLQKWVNSSTTGDYIWTTPVSVLAGATTVTISNANIHTSSTVEVFISVQGMPEPSMTITEGQCVLTFDALAQDTSFKLRVTN